MSKRAVLLALVLLLFATGAECAERHLNAGAGLRVPAERIIAKFESETGHSVRVEYGGMGQLLARYKATGSGDAFLSGSEEYVQEIARDGGVIAERPLVLHTAVMVVAKNKSDGIANFEDLARSNLRLGLGDPKAIALGRTGETMLDASGFGEELRQKVVVRATSIKQIFLYVLNGEVDAAVIGRSDAVNNPSLVMLPSPEGIPQNVSVIAALASSRHPEAAKQLVDFFSRKENIQLFLDQGFLPVAE